MAIYDVLGAKKAGLSDADIADYLASSSEYDLEAARKAGVSNKEIISYLNKTGASALDTFTAAAKQAVGYIKSGNGPFFLELTTYRWREHCGPNYDNNIGYRSEEEFLNWKAKDPILAYKNVLLERNWATHSEMSKIEQQLVEEIENAFLFAENSNFPDQAEAFTDEYASNKEHI